MPFIFLCLFSLRPLHQRDVLMVRLGEINPQVWDEITAYMEKKLKKFEFSSEDLLIDFRVAAG